MLELVRALSKRSERTRANARQMSTKESAQSERADLEVLRKRLGDLVKDLDPRNGEAVARVRRPLLQEIVLWEFGGDFRQHPEFAPMMDTIERAFEADPSAPDRFAALIRDLRR